MGYQIRGQDEFSFVNGSSNASFANVSFAISEATAGVPPALRPFPLIIVGGLILQKAIQVMDK